MTCVTLQNVARNFVCIPVYIYIYIYISIHGKVFCHFTVLIERGSGYRLADVTVGEIYSICTKRLQSHGRNLHLTTSPFAAVKWRICIRLCNANFTVPN